MTAPLAGLLVADFSRVLAGPLASMMLADLGADVIKVERPETGDDTRSWGPPFVDGESAYYLSVNRNKRSVALDLRSDDGHRAALALVDRADVLVENFSSGVMERFGLGWETVRQRNRRLVYCSISGFGHHAGATLAGYDFLVQATGGLMSITGNEGGESLKTGVAVVDVMAGLHATIGVLAALQDRERTGSGQRVDINLMSSLLSGLVNQASSYVNAGVIPSRAGNRHPSITPYETLQAADGTLALAVGTDRQFASLCAELELDELPADPRYATNAARVANRADLVVRLTGKLRGRPVAYWTRTLNAVGVPCGPVNDIADAFAMAADLGLEPIRSITRADGTAVRQVSSPLGLSASPVEYRLPPPALGEDTDGVLAWLSADAGARSTGSGDAAGETRR